MECKLTDEAGQTLLAAMQQVVNDGSYRFTKNLNNPRIISPALWNPGEALSSRLDSTA